jgi:hypothetical protein
MCPKGPTDIEKQRAEILRLIARVDSSSRSHAGGSRPTPREPAVEASVAHAPSERSAPERRPRREEPAAPSNGASTERLDMRRRELAEIKQRRQRLAAIKPDNRVLELLHLLDGRVAGIEELLREGGVASSSAQAQLAPPDSTFGGILKEGLLADMLQFASSNHMTGVFTVDDGEGTEVHFYFDEGEIVHAEGPDAVGESAVFTGMAFMSGSYYFRETDELPEERTIESKTQFLILESLRRVDEDRAG